MSKDSFEDCKYYIWEENKLVDCKDFKAYYAEKALEDNSFKNFSIKKWAEYASDYNKEDKLSYSVWLTKNMQELKEQWKTTE